jgi:NADPH:quinone reductase-like Zn-dependent oxidoreductase
MEVGPAEYPTVGEGEIIVKASAIAINPMDWFIQIMGEKLFSFLKYPYCGGDDVAGTVVEVGSGVTNFKPGDRVFGVDPGFDAREGAFQEYVVLKANATAHIPADATFEQASVLPLAICSAAAGLYQKNLLALEYPSLDPKPKGETLLIWAGASSVGSNGIQLAVASGYEVFTTASPKNFGYCKSLGASKVFDYKDPNVVTNILAAFEGKTCRGALAIQRGSEDLCFEIVAKAPGTAKFVASAVPLNPEKVPAGITARFLNAASVPKNEVGELIWTEFLPSALEQNKYQFAPPPLVVGQGLEKLQEAIDKGKTGGASAQKLVVTL